VTNEPHDRARVLFVHVGDAEARPGHHGSALKRKAVRSEQLEPRTRAEGNERRLDHRVVVGAGQIAEQQAGTVACIEEGFRVTTDERERFVAAVTAALRGAELCIISGSVPDLGMDDIYRRMADAAAAAGVPCWIDSYGKAMLAALAGANPPALAKPNKQEYGGDPQPWLAARELHLTDGAGQVTVRAPEGRWRVAPPAVSEANPIGSGDCWLAGYAHGRLSGWDIPRALAWASAAGAANACRVEVARIGPEDIKPLVDRVQVTPAP